MGKEKINEIATLVEKQMEHIPQNHYENRIFLNDLLRKYNLSDEDWKIIMNECNKRTEKMEKKLEVELFFDKYITKPLLKILYYIVIVYTQIFITISILNIYSTPSRILFPYGTYPEREQVINFINIMVVGLGIFLLLKKAKKT